MNQKENGLRRIFIRSIFAVAKSPFLDCLVIGSFLLYFSENSLILGLLNTDTSTMQNWGMIFTVIAGIILIFLIPLRIRPIIWRNLIWRPFP